MKDLLLVVPSRGRPASIGRLREAMAATCRGDTTLLVGLDDDDPQLPDYLDLKSTWKDLVQIEPDLHQVVAWINKLAMSHVRGYKYVGHIGDDNVPSTIGWDVAIMEALEKTPFAFGNDLYPLRPAGALCCHVFCRSEVLAALGYFGPPSLRHSYVDDVWMRWGEATGITFLQDVIIEHLHHTVGKSPADQNYADSGGLTGQDAAAYSAYCATELESDIGKIRGCL